MSKILSYLLKNPEVVVHASDINTFIPQIFYEIKTLDDIVSRFKTLPVKDIKVVLMLFWSGSSLKKATIAHALREYYQTLKIPFYCLSWNSIFISSALLTCVREHGNEALENEMVFIFCDEHMFAMFNVIKETKNYRISSYSGLSPDCLDKIVVSISAKVFITCNHKSADDGPPTDKQKEVQKMVIKKCSELTKKKICVINENLFEYINEVIVHKVEKLLEKKEWKYDVSNIGIFNYALIFRGMMQSMVNLPIPDILKKSLISIHSGDCIPIKKEIVFYDNFHDICLARFELGNTTEVGNFLLLENGTSISLSIDKYFTSSFEIKNNNNTAIKNAAIITFGENKFSVEKIRNGNLINLGLNNISMMISFVEGKIQIGEEAAKLKETHNHFVIYDLMKIIKTDPAKLKADPKWGFELLHKENSKILLEFDTFRGRRKATPPFLFAFFIRWAVKNVEFISKNNEFPKTIVLVIKNLDDRIRKNLMEACKWAKLDPKNVQIHEYKIVEIKEKNVK